MPEIFIYQIRYTARETLDPGFRVLDNSSNERPDWFEYWPIRRFLLNEPLDEQSFYGFLSPKFKQKTNLSAAAAHEFVSRESAADVILLSPSLHLSAPYWNVFQYGDKVHPGLARIAAQFFERIGQPADLEALVTHSRNEIYSNYVVAKPGYWRAWLGITEQLFAIAESPEDPLGAELRAATSYRGARRVHMKVFILERIATWILCRNPGFVVRVCNPFAARSRIYKVPAAIACDALKIAYLASGRSAEYKDLFDFLGKSAGSLNWQIRVANLLGFRHVRACLKTLGSYWTRRDA